METFEKRKTGTTTVGLLTKDAVVLAADKRATAGHYIAGKNITKIIPINDNLVVTITGAVSDIQLTVKYIRAELKLKELKTGVPTSVKAAANLIAGFNYSGLRMQGSIAGFLLAGFDHDGVSLYEVTVDGVVSKVESFEASGSGTTFAIAVFESQYKPGMTEAEGITLAKRAITTAIERDTGSGNGFDVFVVNKAGMQLRETVHLRNAPSASADR